jgi:hypothetical protein
MVITNAFRILFLWASCSCFSVIQQRQAVVYLVFPVVDAFTLPSKYSFSLRGGCCYPTNDGDDDDDDDSRHLFSSCSASLRETSSDRQQQRRRRRQGKRPTLQLEATKKGTQERKVGGDQTTAVATAFQIQREKQWLQKLEEFKVFQDVHGHCNIPQSQGSLGIWVNNQRKNFNKDRMREDRKELLHAIGFVWGPVKEAWQRNCENLLSYKNKNGHCNVPQSEGNLGVWVNSQRRLFNRDRMPKERIDLLEELGFVWDSYDETWQNTYKELEEFQRLHGHVNVPAEDTLSAWTMRQRLDHAAGRLDLNKKAMLDVLGLVWEDPDSERHERQWIEMFHELEQYKLLKGHVRVPVATSSLGHWVKRQRKIYHEGRLLEHREAKLKSIAFIWRLREERDLDTTTWDEKWMKKYEALKEFQDEHGDANIRLQRGSLGTWVDTQRQHFRKDKLREDRRDLLDEIGFEWELGKVSSDERWQASYDELQSYQMEFGHLHVSQIENLALYEWIYFQRKMQQAGRLGSKRTALFDDLGMNW